MKADLTATVRHGVREAVASLLDPFQPDDDEASRSSNPAPTRDLKDTDGAIELLGPYFERVSVSELKHCAADPDMDPLRDDPRFQQMAAAASARLDASGVAPAPLAKSPRITNA